MPKQIKKIIVKDNESRIDVYLSKHLETSRSKVQEFIDDKLVTVNDVLVTKNGHKVYNNDVIIIDEKIIDDKPSKVIEPYNYDLNILFEDEYLLIVYKPSGMLSHPTSFNESDTLVNALKSRSINHDSEYLLVHRIDKDTSGLVLIAKEENVYRKLQSLFENREIIKKYYALIHNRLNINHFIIDIPIGRSKDNKLKMSTSKNCKNPKNSITEVTLIKNYHQHALVDVNLKTGRTHQIRVHLKHINHPIVNDPLYGIEKETTNYGQCLIAYYIGFVHPITNVFIEQKIDLDNEFKDIIKVIEEIK